MAAQPELLDIVDAIRGGVEAVKAAFDKGVVRLRLHALPRSELRIRARKRIIRLDEGKLARLERALVSAALEKKGGRILFKEYANKVGDYKAAAAYLAYLWRTGLLGFDDETAALNLFVAANALSQKTYEHRIARVLEAGFTLNLERLAEQPADTILCAQADGRVACRYIVANLPRSQAKALARGIFETAGFKPA